MSPFLWTSLFIQATPKAGVLRNARIITMQRDKIIEHGTIVIKDGRFSAMGSVSSIQIPKGAKIIDIWENSDAGSRRLASAYACAPQCLPKQSWMFWSTLAYGVTTAHDPSASYDSYGYSELLQSGQMIGPRLFTVGNSVRFMMVSLAWTKPRMQWMWLRRD